MFNTKLIPGAIVYHASGFTFQGLCYSTAVRVCSYEGDQLTVDGPDCRHHTFMVVSEDENYARIECPGGKIEFLILNRSDAADRHLSNKYSYDTNGDMELAEDERDIGCPVLGDIPQHVLEDWWLDDWIEGRMRFPDNENDKDLNEPAA